MQRYWTSRHFAKSKVLNDVTLRARFATSDINLPEESSRNVLSNKSNQAQAEQPFLDRVEVCIEYLYADAKFRVKQTAALIKNLFGNLLDEQRTTTSHPFFCIDCLIRVSS